jgi:hypothetical protein
MTACSGSVLACDVVLLLLPGQRARWQPAPANSACIACYWSTWMHAARWPLLAFVLQILCSCMLCALLGGLTTRTQAALVWQLSLRRAQLACCRRLGPDASQLGDLHALHAASHMSS